MGSAIESRQARIIDELRGFIKKVLTDPTIPTQCMEVARKYRNHEDADRLIAEEISATTNIRIPEKHSEADKLFLEVLRDALDDEAALY